MGQFANTLFGALLGWVQMAASWLWGLFTNADAGQWLHWLLDNWLSLTLGLCAAGVAIDFIVYLLRWQPYRVWGSFLRRVTAKEPLPPKEEAQPVFQRKWAYADGSTSVEDVHEPLQEAAPAQLPPLETPIRPTRRLARRTTPEQAYHQPVYPPQWQQSLKEQQENFDE